MKSKLSKIIISFILIILTSIPFSSYFFIELGLKSPYIGLLFVLGLLFGPYGALGAVLGNIVIDYSNGYGIMQIIPSAIFSFGVSYLAYKLWYSGFKSNKITKPRLDNINHLILFLSSIIVCGFLYSIFHGNLLSIILKFSQLGYKIAYYKSISYFFNFINTSFILGIIGIWISKRIDFVVTPEKSKKTVNKKLYRILFSSLIVVAIITLISLIFETDENLVIGELILIGILLFAYLTKPQEYEIQANDENTMIEKIIRNFLIITLIIAILGMLFTILSYDFLTNYEHININVYLMPSLIITDLIIILFFIPGIIILKYIENKIIEPISSFSEIEGFIAENEKIETDGLLDIYSKYINEKNEIGTLARSYTDLINYNNNYIENIKEIEGEKERLNAELDIATKIQAAALPTGAIRTDDFIVSGYSQPAKEVGGDFFDYYPLDDENLAIIIGDASGKGVPAALLAMVTQVIIKQLMDHNQNPSQILYTLNNQLYENNPESMFITLWLGVYNRTTHKLTFSNAGHNPPLIKENNEFGYLNMDAGIVLGIMGDYKFINKEITLTNELIVYTDGITDAHNKNDEMYGEDRLQNFFNKFESNEDPITPLLDDINAFVEGNDQFDDMTLLYLKIKND